MRRGLRVVALALALALLPGVPCGAGPALRDQVVSSGVTSQYQPQHFLRNHGTPEEERHVDCTAECTDRSDDPVCGTNGITYKNICDLDRNICKKVKVALKHRGECSLAEMCVDARTAKLEQVDDGEKVYVPTCLEDGLYAPVQCHNFTGYCWCSHLDGSIIPNTYTEDGRPPNCQDRTQAWSNPDTATQERCTGRLRRSFTVNMAAHLVQEYRREKNVQHMSEKRVQRKAVKWKFGQLDNNDDGQLQRREYRRLRKTVRKFIKPKKCAKKFPKLCDTNGDSQLVEEEWTACFSLTGQRRSGRRQCRGRACRPRSSRPRGGAPKPSCEWERQMTLESGADHANNSIPILECQSNGRYQPIQCHRDICICVDELTGNSLDGTGVKNGTPDCSRPRPHARDWPGCVGEAKTKFMQDLKKFLLSKVEGGGRAAGAASATQSVEEFAAKYHFRSLDKNHNQYLEKGERKQVKKLFKGNRKLKRCGRRITLYCDVNRDNKVSLQEWVACVIMTPNDTGNNATGAEGDNVRRIEENPLHKYLVPEEESERLKNRNW